MTDLFDINVGGAGFHFTSHFIALAALFIASFAIAGYITFKNNSIDRKKLRSTAVVRDGKDGDSWVYRQTFTLSDLSDVDGADDVAVVVPLQLQKDSVIHGVKLVTVDAGSVAANLTLRMHNKELIVGSAVPAGATTLSDALAIGTDATNANIDGAGRIKTTSVVNYFYLSSAADISATTNTPQIHVQINWVGPAPIGY